MNNHIEAFIRENRGNWFIKESPDIVLIEGRNLPIQILSSGLIANILNQQHGYFPMIVSSGSQERRSRALYESFGVSMFREVNLGKEVRTVSGLMRSSLGTLRLAAVFTLKRMDYDWFIASAKLNEIKVGDLIYDSYVRHGHTYINPWKRLDKLIKLTLRAALICNVLEKLFAVNRVKLVVVSTTVYGSLGGLLARIALKKHIPVIVSTGIFAKRLTKESDAFKSFYQIEPNFLRHIDHVPDWKQQLEEYLEKRFSGNIFQHDVLNAYKDKKQYSKKKLLAKLGISSQDNIFIAYVMPHAFSDAVHGAGPILFRDYYQWYVKTLDHIATIDNVLWIVKPHPSSYKYGEEGIAEAVFRKLNAKNVVLCPVDMTTASVFDTADAVVTVRGTIGIEAPCMGVPAVLAGDAPFGGYGFTHDPKTQEEYFQILSNIKGLKRLTEAQMTKARQALYWYHLSRFSKSTVIPGIKITPGQTKEAVEQLWDKIFRDLRINLKTKTFVEDPYYQKLENFLSGNDRVIEP